MKTSNYLTQIHMHKADSFEQLSINYFVQWDKNTK